MNGLTLRVSSKSKKRAPAAVLPPLVFPDFHLHYFQKNEKYRPFIEAKSADLQLAALKGFLGMDDFLDDTMKLVAAVYMSADPKHPLKCYLARYVTKSNDNVQKTFEKWLLYELNRIFLQMDTNPPSVSQAEMSQAITAIVGCSENFPVGVRVLQTCREPLVEYLEKALQYQVKILSHHRAISPTDKNEVFTLIHIILRALLNVFQKPESYDITHAESFGLIYKWMDKLIAENTKDVPLDTKSLCGILRVTMGTLSQGQDYWIKLVEELHGAPCDGTHQAVDLVCQYGALVTVVPVANLEEARIGGVPGIELLVNRMLEISERYSIEPLVALSSARALLGASRALLRGGAARCSPAAPAALRFVWAHMEHHADSVRHLAEQLLANVLKYLATRHDDSSPNAFDVFFSELTSLPKDKKAYYVGLAASAGVLGTAAVLRRLPGLIPALTHSLSQQSLQANIATTMNTLLKKHMEEASTEQVYESWVRPILQRVYESAHTGSLDSDTLNILENIITYAIKCDRNIMDLILPEAQRICSAPRMGPGDLKCVLVCLNLARRVGSLPSPRADHPALWRGILCHRTLQAALVHSSEEIRILALSLLVETSKSTEHFSAMELQLFLYFLKYNINTQSPSVRHLTLSLLKKLIRRLECSYRVLKREGAAETIGGPTTEMYLDFIRTLRGQCFDSLLPGANYSRRAIALDILERCEALEMEGYQSHWCEEYVEKLLHHLEDSYENNKGSALNILTHCPMEYLEKFYSANLFLPDILKQASSVKPPDCVSAAYKLQLLQHFNKAQNRSRKQNEIGVPEEEYLSIIQGLLERVREELAVAQDSILVAASCGPMYGLLLCIHHLLARVNPAEIAGEASWSRLVSLLIGVCVEVTRAAAPVVNNSSPEGHLPMDAGCVPGAAVTAQMVLLCAWRSVKEVSLILGVISSNLHISGEDGPSGSWSQRDAVAMGEHFTSLLSETKHRGAFEQAYVGFTKLCARLWQCKSPALHGLPGAWLDNLMREIATCGGGGGGGKLCATRRSAGVPFMIQALVTTELQVVGAPKQFHRCMESLLRLAGGGAVETRTHCLNVLRALYRHAGLGAVVHGYVDRGLVTAIRGFEGTTWAERNSSTLLFSALMVRVFGVQRGRDADRLCIRNRMTGRTFFLRYPSLYDFMLEKLTSAAGSRDAAQPALYPVLLLLARLYPYTLEETTANLKLVAFIPHVVACGGSGVLKTRQLAAKALVPLVSCDKYIFHLNELLRMLTDKQIKRNFCHGILLQLVRLLEWKPVTLKVDASSYLELAASLQDTFWILEEVLSSKPCYITADEYLKLINLLLWRFPSILQMKDYILKVKSLLMQLFETKTEHDFYGKDVFLADAFKLYLILLIKFEQTTIPDLIIKNLLHESYDVVLSDLDFILLVHKEIEEETNCKFQKVMTEITDENVSKDILVHLNKSLEFRRNLYEVVASKSYLECVQKALTVLSLYGDTQEGLLRMDDWDPNRTSELIICELLARIQAEHENVSYINIKSLHTYISKVTSCGAVLREGVWTEIVRVLYGSCSSDNNESKRRNIVSFLEDNAVNLCNMQFKDLSETTIFDYHSTIWATLVTLLEDDEDVLRQKVSNLVLKLSDQNGAKDIHQVIPSKASEILLNFIEKYYSNTNDAVAAFLILALLDFNSEVCIGDYIMDEHRVFDSNEKYNILLEESNWTKECVGKIRKLLNTTETQAIIDCVSEALNNERYRSAFQELCPVNSKAFARLFPDHVANDETVNPKVQLCIKMLCK